MLSEAEAKDMIVDLFEEEALVIGGLVAVHGVEDDMVWRLVRSLDTVCRKALRRLETGDESRRDGTQPNLNPHPAIELFLRKLRSA